MKTCLQTSKAPAAIGPYSQAVQCGSFVYISGQIALDPLTGLYNPQSVAEETKLALQNMKAILEEANCTFTDVVKTTIFLANMKDFSDVNEVYSECFSENPPARACMAVKTLPKNCKVEIEAIAYKEI